MTTKLSLATLDDIGDRASLPAYRREEIRPGSCISVSAISTARIWPYICMSCSTRGGIWTGGSSRRRHALRPEDARHAEGAGFSDDRRRAGHHALGCDGHRPDARRDHGTGFSQDHRDPGGPLDPHRFDDDHRRRLFHRSGNRQVRPSASGDRRGCADPRRAKDCLRVDHCSLKARRDAGHPPFTVMCCDNIPGNGEVTEATLCGLANLSDPDFAHWIHENVAFPNSMWTESHRRRAREKSI